MPFTVDIVFYCGKCLLLLKIFSILEDEFYCGRQMPFTAEDSFHCERYLSLWKIPFAVKGAFHSGRCLSLRKVPFTVSFLKCADICCAVVHVFYRHILQYTCCIHWCVVVGPGHTLSACHTSVETFELCI